ncbi:MAG: class I SAM-dependent methyltransferase [Nitrospirota bacterium]
MGGTNGRGLSLRRVSSPEAYAEYEQALACETVVPMLGRWGIAIGGAAILDAGCGMGGVTVALAARGARVLGLEIDSERVEAARRFAEKSGVSAQYVCADAAASSSLDGYRDFDGIVLRDVVEHVADSGGMLSRLRGSIRGSGWMFVSFPPYYSPYGGHQHHPQSRTKYIPWVQILPGRLYERWLPDIPEYRAEVRSLNRMTISRFEREVRESGWKVREREHYVIRPSLGFKHGLPVVRAGLLGRLPGLRELVVTGSYYLLVPE